MATTPLGRILTMTATLLGRIFTVTAGRPVGVNIHGFTPQGRVARRQILIAQRCLRGEHHDPPAGCGREQREGLASVGQVPLPERGRAHPRISSQGRYRTARAVVMWKALPVLQSAVGRESAGSPAGACTRKAGASPAGANLGSLRDVCFISRMGTGTASVPLRFA